MKNERSGSKSGPRSTSRSGSKSRPKTGYNREATADAKAGPKKEYHQEARPDAKAGPKKEYHREARPDTKAGPKKEYNREARPDAKAGPKKEYNREARPDAKAEPKKEYNREARPDAKAGPKKEYHREARPDTKAGPKKEYKGDAKFGPKPEPKVSFSPTLGTKKPIARPAKPELKAARGATQAFPPKRYINVYLSLGSNVGDRMANLRAASLLIDKNMGKIARKSHVYETEPWGKTDQDMFLNQVMMVNTTLTPRDLLEIITEIERELGREKKEKWGSRIIDVDILFYGKRVIRDKGLDIPHPELHKRAFVLAPMMEIAPDLEHPVLKLPIDELYIACKDPCEVVMLD